METIKILFIGNRYTYNNNLPLMLKKLAEAGKQEKVETAISTQLGTESINGECCKAPAIRGEVDVTSAYKESIHYLDCDQTLPLNLGNAPNNCIVNTSFEWHYINPQTRRILDEDSWNYVVIQDQSLMPVLDRSKTLEFGKQLIDEIRQIGAEPLLFLTWARLNISNMQEILNDTYISLSRMTETQICPVGPAWQLVVDSNPEIPLHEVDKSYPTAFGTFLSACVFYSTIFDKSPLGLPGTLASDGTILVDLPENQARYLESVAWKIKTEFQI
jgi:hypothetical protein